MKNIPRTLVFLYGNDIECLAGQTSSIVEQIVAGNTIISAVNLWGAEVHMIASYIEAVSEFTQEVCDRIDLQNKLEELGIN